MDSASIRETFINFFKSKNHKYLKPSHLVNTSDKTLMFTNAGMNQLKNVFLGLKNIDEKKLVNSQPCLRISGKHNDINEVGIDSYHHTLFEMLGNWSINDYFKEEAIHYAWELLTKKYELNIEDLYITVFSGDEEDNIPMDNETYNIWSKIVAKDHILCCSKKDNFWEMGDVGPCGPCTEIHIDLREKKEKAITPGIKLVNTGHREVIEIWNIVFIQFERNENNILLPLKSKFVDTGMGLERLAMVLQKKNSTYDTDIFYQYINTLEQITNCKYTGSDKETDIAFRVISDHIRTIVMAMVEGLKPSNVQEGYVIRMLIRRAQKYGINTLHFDTPFLSQFVDIVIAQFKDIITTYDHIVSVEEIKNILLKEENAFLKVLNDGKKKIKSLIENYKNNGVDIISGAEIFKIQDTYGFPIDIAKDIIKSHNMSFDEKEYEKCKLEHKQKSNKN